MSVQSPHRLIAVLVLATAGLAALGSMLDNQRRVEARAVEPLSSRANVLASAAAAITLSTQVQPARATTEQFQGLTDSPYQVEVNPVTGYVYVGGSDQVTVLTATQVVTNITVGSSPFDIAVNPATGYVYVPLIPENKVAILSGTHLIERVAAGTFPRAAAVDSATGYVYVANQDSGNITILSDTAIITTVAVSAPGETVYDVAVNPGSGYVYASLQRSFNAIAVIRGLEVVSYIPMSGDLRTVAVDPVRGYTYIARYGDETTGAVIVVSGTQALGTVPAPYPSNIIVNPATGYAYVTNFVDNSVTVLSGTQVIATWPTSGRYPDAMAVNPRTSKVYVFSIGSSLTQNFIDILSGTHIIRTMTATGPGVFDEAAVNPNTGYVYAPSFVIPAELLMVSGSDEITLLAVGAQPTASATNEATGYTYVSAANNTVKVFSATHAIATLPVSSYPAAIGANSNTGLTYIVNQWSNNVTVVSSTIVLANINVGFSPMAIDVNPKTGFVYVANRDGPIPITVLSGTQVLTTIAWPNPIGEKQIAVDLSANRVYVLNTTRGELIVLSGTQVITNVFIGSTPSAIAVNSNNGYVYVTDKNANTVTVLDDTHIVTILPTIAAPSAIAVNSTTGHTYIAGQGMTVLSGTKFLATLAVGCGLIKVDIDSSTGRVYALDDTDQTTIIVSGIQVLARLPVGGQPTMVHINSANHAAYVGSSNPDSLSIIYGDEVNLQSRLVRLTGPTDTVVIDFGQPVLTPTVLFAITPTLSNSVTWSASANHLMIELDDVQPTTFYQLQFSPYARTVSGLRIVVSDSIRLILQPFESFLSIVGRNVGCVH